MKNLRANVGSAGSGVPNFVDKLLDINRIDPSGIKKSQFEQILGVMLMSFAQSEAYSRRLPFLSPAVLPRGVVDIAKDIPALDVRLVA